MSNCILFKNKLSNGLPIEYIDGKRVNMNRHLFKGNLPREHKVFKKCKNNKCINPDHFYSGMMDQYTSPVYPDRSCENNQNVVLTQDQVDEIRKYRLESSLSYKRIGLKFKISGTHAWRICNNKSWEE